jgi:hypothetical protein
MKTIVDGIAEPVRMAIDAYSLGVSSSGMEAMVDGIAESIRWAHEAIQPGSIFIRYGCHGSGVHKGGHTMPYSLGGSSSGMDAMVAESIRRSHEAIQPGSIFITYGSCGGGHTRPTAREYLHQVWKS